MHPIENLFATSDDVVPHDYCARELARFRSLTPGEKAAEEAEWQADGDRIYADWLASGEPDWYELWQEKQKASRAAANEELDAIERTFRAVLFASETTDEECEAAEAIHDKAVAEWHSKHDHLWPKRSEQAQSAGALNAAVKYPSPEESAKLANQIRELAAQAIGPQTGSSLLRPRTDTDWVEVDSYAKPVPSCSDNVGVFLRREQIALRFNAWTESVEISNAGGAWEKYEDRHFDILMTLAASAKHRFRPSEAGFRRAVNALAFANEIDPAIDRLDELERLWDGQPRLSVWLSAACGVACDQYHQAVGRIIVGSMVRRIRHPGCKSDMMAVFESGQGDGKSTLAAMLAPDAGWFTDNVYLGMETKELILQLRGKAVVEISEMRTRGEVNAVKHFISRQVDSARTAYGHLPTDRPRRNIFIGSTNQREMLEDSTGGRRFLPVHIRGELNLDWIRANVDQLIGEACVLESKGDTFGLPRELWRVAADRQEEARAKEDFEIVLEEVFHKDKGALVMSAADLAISVQTLVGRPVQPKRYADMMRRLDFVSTTQRPMGTMPSVAVWRRGTAEQAKWLPRIIVDTTGGLTAVKSRRDIAAITRGYK